MGTIISDQQYSEENDSNYKILKSQCLGNMQTLERLIQFELSKGVVNRQEAIKRAVERIQRDNR